MIEPYKDSMSAKQSFSRWTMVTGEWSEGEVVLPEGIVSAYMQGDDDHFHHTRLDFVAGGRLHIWSWKKRYSKRGVVTLAKKMVAEITSVEKGQKHE